MSNRSQKSGYCTVSLFLSSKVPNSYGHSVIDHVYKLKLQEPRRDFVTKAIQSEQIEGRWMLRKSFLRWERNWDLREPGENERRRGFLPTATRHLLLIRQEALTGPDCVGLKKIVKTATRYFLVRHPLVTPPHLPPLHHIY